MRYYRGYVKADGKKAVEKFKGVGDDELRTLDEAKKCESYAGILAPGVVLLDFDIKEMSDTAYTIIQAMGIKCMIRRSTKGWHFLMKANHRFTKSQTRVRLACGLVCDIKLGDKNSYEALKVFGDERPIVHECDEPDVVPAFLSPVESDKDFFKAGEGEGRNAMLYGYLLTLSKYGFTPDEAKETVNVINNYVFADPLEQRELNTICRDEAFVPVVPDFFDEKGRFLFDVFAGWLVENQHIVRIDGGLHIYKNGIYISGEDDIERAMIKHIPRLNKAKRAETYAYIHLLVEGDKPRADARYIGFKNGIYDIVRGELMDFTPEIALTNIIPHYYDPNAKSELLESTLLKMACGKPEMVQVMYEMVGAMFYRKNEIANGISAYFLLGEGSNGKSTFIDLISYLIGLENTSALTLEDLNRDFKSQRAYGKLLNAGDDISGNYIEDPSVFKKFATGNRLTANPKYQEPFEFVPYCKLLFSANNMPRMNDPTNAAKRRILPLPFNATFSEKDPDFRPFIKYDLMQEEVASAFINLALEGLNRLLVNNRFTPSADVDVELEIIEETNNPIKLFIKENDPTDQTVRDMYARYTLWCTCGDYRSLSRSNFVNQMERYGYKVQTSQLGGNILEIFLGKEVE